jgi:hypothetical protein
MAVQIKPPKTANNADFDLIGYIQEKMMKEFSTELWKGIENILRLYIDHPIEGELTKEKMKAAGVMGLIHEKYPKPWDIDTSSDKDVKVTINSSILGVRQGDMLIQFNGDRMHISYIPVEWYEERFIYDDED